MVELMVDIVRRVTPATPDMSDADAQAIADRAQVGAEGNLFDRARALYQAKKAHLEH